MINNNKNMSASWLAKFVMKKFKSFPDLSGEKFYELNEVFNQKEFLEGTIDSKRDIMLKSSQIKYTSEFNYPFDNYFGFKLLPILKNKSVLDLGCFTGGRSAAWFERYNLKEISGIDIKQVHIDAAIQFAGIKKISYEYKVGFGESIPFENDRFDAILSFDVFEHVQNLEKTLRECYRVLKPGGKLIAVFPSYYQPIEHHLGLVTKLPILHYFFTGKNLVRAYYEILQERGEDAYWYRRNTPVLESWEKGNTINGTTLYKFRKLIKNVPLRLSIQSRMPMGSIGRSTVSHKWMKSLSFLFIPLTYIPFVQETVLHRISVILEKEFK